VRISRNSGAFGKLDLNFNQETFSISGPNGSGKSGVIDAIEFAMAAWDDGFAVERPLGNSGLTVPDTSKPWCRCLARYRRA
jgi:predicted ATP-binding protein involved in virulence